MTQQSQDEAREVLKAIARPDELYETVSRSGDAVVYVDSAAAIRAMLAFSARSAELERALSFCYALVRPGQDANALIAANPDRAAAAHRAIYERKPQAESYDAMVVRITGHTKPAEQESDDP